MTDQQIERLKVVMIYRSIPSFDTDAQIDLELSKLGLIELSKHGARITEKGVNKVKELQLMKV